MPVPDIVVSTACRATTDFHRTDCRCCIILAPLHRILHPLLARTALSLLLVTVTVVVALANGHPLTLTLIGQSLLAILVFVHVAWLTCAVTALTHQRRVRNEVELRVHTARIHLTQPHP